jgi:hypothetical protein
MNPVEWLNTVTGIAGKVADKVLAYIPDPEQRFKALQEINQMDLSADAQQIAVNVEEAKSEKWWKAGWRPNVGWACGAAVWYNYIIAPFLTLILHIWWPELVAPKLDMMDLMTLLFGMLGLSYHRSQDKQALLK